MRWFSIATAVLLSPGALADDLVPLDEAQLAARGARMTLFVSPQYPAAAVREGIQATVDVIGIVREDGTLGTPRMEVKPEREDFRKAVEEVLPYWMLYPRYDDSCRYQLAEGQVRVWFEMKEGKPVVSFSMPRKTDATPAPAASADSYRAISTVKIGYPEAARVDGREGSVIALLRVPDSGEVENVILVPGRHNLDFGPTVTKALRRWKFAATPRPAHCFEYTVNFQLR